MRLKDYLINEEKNQLGHRISDVMIAMQDVQEEMPNLGSRQLIKIANDLVNQIRKILHGHWSSKNKNHLIELQKIAVAIMKTIEERGDLKEILPASTKHLQKTCANLGIKINDLDAPESQSDQGLSAKDFQQTPSEQTPNTQSPPEMAQLT